MTIEAFAQHLGASVRTVANWEAKPDIVLSNSMQEVLDTAYERAPSLVRERFAITQGHEQPERSGADIAPAAVALAVSIAIVTCGDEVLLVCRRDEGSGLTWQFPAGVVKPGATPSSVAIRETLGETGVHCSISESLGQRVHPMTGVLCHYFRCEYLAGEASNQDVIENASVDWVTREAVTRFIPEDRIYEPVLRTILEGREDAVS
jgi:8-oxo-dGTP diphosphatase